MPKLRIATRGSELALAQAEYVEQRLQQMGYETEKVILKTTGDVNLAPFAMAAGDARKGLFTKEIEDALLAKEAEVAVHSYKDLPSVTVPELVIAAIPQRLDARDYILFLKSKRVREDFPCISLEGTVGTSSVRRRSQLKFLFPSLKVEELRGNVPTRVKKLFEPNGPDAILLSGAGVERLIGTGRFVPEDLLVQLDIVPVSPSLFIPAPAQGTLAVQCRADDAVSLEALSRMHDPFLAKVLGIERGVLAALEGGCHLPLGIHAQLKGVPETPESASGSPDKYFEAGVYLGEEYAKTRYGRSVQFTRRHRDPVRLESFLESELKDPVGKVPVFVFGRRSRMLELEKAYGIKGFGVLNPVLVGEQDSGLIREAIGRARTLALFSAEGIRSLSSVYGSGFASIVSREDLVWAVPGRRTADLLLQSGVRSERITVGEDGTGAGTARTLLSQARAGQSGGGLVVGLSAEEGRDEFFQILREGGMEVERFSLYRTEYVPLSQQEIESIGNEAYLIFGSPSSFKTFAASVEKAGASWSEGWRICSIGQTTSDVIRSPASGAGLERMEPYLTAVEPDYERIIREIRGE